MKIRIDEVIRLFRGPTDFRCRVSGFRRSFHSTRRHKRSFEHAEEDPCETDERERQEDEERAAEDRRPQR